MILDLNTALLLLVELVARHTVRQFDVSVEVFPSVGIPTEVGDYLEVFFSRVNFGRLTLCEVIKKGIGFRGIEWTVRTVRDLGFFEPWDFPLVLLEQDRFNEPWDA